MELDLMMFVPANRAIAFGVLAGLAYMASRSSDNVIKKIDENKYGLCEVCGKEIENDRLEANPSAKTCKEHMNS
jgi:hypothetical protein